MSRLPFKDNSFQVVLSADAVEHIPAVHRIEWLKEMRRVSAGKVVIHCPIQQEDVGFVATAYDRKFNDAHRYLFGVDEPNTQEHLRHGSPTLDQVRSALPGATVRGTQNARVWYFCILAQRIPFVSLLVGPMHRFLLWPWGQRPPFYSALIVDDPCEKGTNG